MQQPGGTSTSTRLTAIEAIRHAIEKGQPIVPFLGAGLSASSGFPLITELRDYLCKVRFLIEKGIYRHLLGEPIAQPQLADSPQLRPSRYIDCFGWPDFNQLDADLWWYFIDDTRNRRGSQQVRRPIEVFSQSDYLQNDFDLFSYEFQVGKMVEDVFPKLTGKKKKQAACDAINGVLGAYLHPALTVQCIDTKKELKDRLAAAIGKKYPNEPDKLISFLNDVQILLAKSHDNKTLKTDKSFKSKASRSPPPMRWGIDRWCLQSAVNHVILEDLSFHDAKVSQQVCRSMWNLDVKPRFDWFRYLLDLAGGRRGLVDSLFSQLGSLRQPSLGHVVLAQLAKEFGWPLFLTINFDSLLENAFHREGLASKVFEISRDAEPPDPSLIISSPLSLLKLHGGSYDLRVGEPIQHSLDEATRTSLFGCIPEDAILLVIGFSGYERRMMQLLEQLAIRPQAEGTTDTRIIWMHWEDESALPPAVMTLQKSLKSIGREKAFLHEHLADAGSFLLDLYQSLSFTLPSTVLTYPALPKRILPAESRPQTQNAETDRHTFQLFVRPTLVDKIEGGSIPTGLIFENRVPSLRMSEYVQSKSEYRLIWIDLEDHHTVSGIVGDIITRMRAYDPHLPELLLPVDDDISGMFIEKQSVETPDAAPHTTSATHKDAIFDKSVRYIRRAIRRGRYIIAFDSLEGFGRQQTSHHGLPEESIATQQGKEIISRHQGLLSFIKGLMAFPDLSEDYYDWYCCISVDEPSLRHITPCKVVSTAKSVIRRIRQDLHEFCTSTIKHKKFFVHPVSESETSHPAPGSVLPVAPAPPVPTSPSPASAAIQTAKRPAPSLRSLVDHLLVFDSSNNEKMRYLKALRNNGWGVLDDAINEGLDKFLYGESGFISDDKHDVENRKDCEILGAFLVMSVFRRPRSKAALMSVLGDLRCALADNRSRDPNYTWITDSIEIILSTEGGLLRPMDGGYYWIPSFAHQWIYKLLSEPARRQTADISALPVRASYLPDWFSKDAMETGNTRQLKRTNRILCLSVVHSRIARFYYRHAYARSHDLSGLYEYLYHRMSAIKYFSTLRGLLQAYDTNQNGSDDYKIKLTA